MWISNIFGNQITLLFIPYFFFFPYDLDTSTTTCRCWFQDIHIFKVVHFSIIYPSFIIFWQDICNWTYFKVFTMLSPLLLDISPQICFTSNLPCTCKMIKLLIFIHKGQFTWFDQSGP